MVLLLSIDAKYFSRVIVFIFVFNKARAKLEMAKLNFPLY